MIQVSIIIPHFNRPALLEESIASVKDQIYKDWEIIIVDDQSDEIAFAAVQKHATGNITIIRRDKGTKGPSSCRNLGALKAVGKYLVFLDSDDLLKPFCLEQRIKFMEENPLVNMGVFLMENFSKQRGDLGTIFNIDKPIAESTALFLRNENPWQTMAPIWKKEFFSALQGFDETLLFMEDPELHLRAIHFPRGNVTTCYQFPADCFYRVNHQDATKALFNFNSIYYRIMFYRKLLLHYPVDFLQKNAVSFRTGIYSMIKTFLYSRKVQFEDLYQETILLMQTSKMFSRLEIYRTRFLIEVGNSNNFLAKKMRLKGICYRLLPAN